MKHQLMIIILHHRKVVRVMSNATFTLLGIYQYGQRIGDDFFEKLTFPAGIDKSVVVNNLLLECADYEVLYPDYDFMKSLVEIFSKKYERTFTKWLAVQSNDIFLQPLLQTIQFCYYLFIVIVIYFNYLWEAPLVFCLFNQFFVYSVNH